MDANDYFKRGKEYLEKEDYIQANENFWKAQEMIFDSGNVAMLREESKDFDPEVVAFGAFEALRQALGERERREHEERERRDREEATEKARKENIRKTWAFFGLFLQFSIMVAFFYRIYIVIKYFGIKKCGDDIPLLIIGGASYLMFWAISLIFRRKGGTFPWGIVFQILMCVVFSIVVSKSSGTSTAASIIAILITAIPGILIFFSGHWILGIIYVVIATAVSCNVGKQDNMASLYLLMFVAPAIPGIIVMINTEN